MPHYYVSGPGPRNGDNGAGFIYRDESSSPYYLRGILSSGKERTPGGAIKSALVSFTDLSFHISWLKEIHDEVHRNSFI